ncbi:polysaccharide lyase [Pedobacter segetis]|nr:hypothetical protein [Pedobacter segetis]
MRYDFNKIRLSIGLVLGLSLTVLLACKKEGNATYPVKNPSEVKPPAETGMITFDNYANGIYSAANAKTDFYQTNISSWKDDRAEIVDKALRVKLMPGDVNQGFYPQFDIVDGTSYEVTFDIKFAKGFDWSLGGKLGVGFGIGDVIAGGNPTNGNGGSARIMWNQTSTGKIIFKPYLYYTDMPDKYGTNVVNSAFYPQSGSLKDDTWYTIKMRVKSNTGFNANGSVQVKVNGEQILSSNTINWGDNSNGKTKGLIKTLMFQTFRGGQGPDWESKGVSYILYDNIKVTKDPTEVF